ncbi:unnamed protein product [Gongylonema pulchrum]|uniref:Uncharacterized protein n=1 Tax=Gongylonema pulchrum TaxID=637853 RepID=A0A183DNM3_9BILA|nr:unnamed protein product [Gongylonema pulchrum]
MEEKVALATVLRRFEVISTLSEEENRALPEVSLKPSRGFPIRTKFRAKAHDYTGKPGILLPGLRYAAVSSQWGERDKTALHPNSSLFYRPIRLLIAHNLLLTKADMI